MTIAVASRDLRNHTAEVLRRVKDGAHLTVTVNGEAVAELSPVRSERPRSFARRDLVAVLTSAQADPGLRHDLAELAGETTDELGPIR
ncbi:MAG: type II toxin-antitoxin system prevent-host-death family antitoxin [Actinomycetota bacterium]|nr:type II toxin-antitoxin system prevent-host-death family antitoxin [Actinomycetota bacterium]